MRVAVQYTDIDPGQALDVLKSIAETHFEPHRKDAVAFNKRIRRRAGIDVGSAEPVFDLTTSELGHYQFHVRFFLPTVLAAKIGSDISTDFLTHVSSFARTARPIRRKKRRVRV